MHAESLRDMLTVSKIGSDAKGRRTFSAKRADDGLRTRDLQLGKLALYQLSYVRVRRNSSTLSVAFL